MECGNPPFPRSLSVKAHRLVSEISRQPACLDVDRTLATPSPDLTCVDVFISPQPSLVRVFKDLLQPGSKAEIFRVDQVYVFRHSCPSTDQKALSLAKELRQDPRSPSRTPRETKCLVRR
jgi:hypothetical protein